MREQGRQSGRGAWAWAAIGAVGLAACLPAASPPAATPEPRAEDPRPPTEASLAEETASVTLALDPEPAEATAPGTPYDCRGIHPARFRWPRPSAAVTADLVAAAHPEDPGTLAPSPALSSALAQAEAIDPATVSTFDRIVIQNTALGVALRLPDPALDHDAASARRVVERFALPARELEAMGPAPWTALDLWIGPRETWVDRKGEACGDGRLLVHDRVFHGTRAFRPMRIGARRALVSQLVALDTEGHAHVTPAVGQIEIRRGLGPGAAACVVELAADALREGDAGGLRTADFAELVRTPFVRRMGERHLGCIGCHQGQGFGDFADVPAAEQDLLRSNRRAATARWLAQAMEPSFTVRATSP